MELLIYLIIPFFIGIALGFCYKKYDSHRSRLDKEIDDKFKGGYDV